MENVAGDVIAAGTALAGLVMVYLGGLSVSFASYEKTAQRTVKAAFKTKGKFAFATTATSLLAVASALFGKRFGCPLLVDGSWMLFLIALFGALVVALLSLLEIK
jgi:hypothetical protein